ncbi:MAG: hypothetical protein ACHREM_31760 [Polyangiales bacterium]
MIDYAVVRESVAGRLAAEIRIQLNSWGFPYQASLTLAHPNDVQPGHPWELVVCATTPTVAIRELLVLLEAWFVDPLAPWISDHERDDCRIFVQRRSAVASTPEEQT